MNFMIGNRATLHKILVHTLLWGLFFYSQYLAVLGIEKDLPFWSYTSVASNQIVLPIVFYLNYFWLIPKYLFNGKYFRYLLLAFLLIFVGSSIMTLWTVFFLTVNHLWELDYIFLNRVNGFRSSGLLLFVTFSCIALKIVQQWMQMKSMQKETELLNLRNQLNPHFLLNTLNNIYALIEFDPQRAQSAVMEVSKLLRHVLYDNQTEFTLLTKEMVFLKSYIELMKIRTSANVEVTFDNEISSNSDSQIAPLLFISLIENAFKHGISPSEDSFINIHIFETDNQQIVCDIKNSNFPKTDQDKSGSGIGLQQVQKRLDLIYPDHYTWIKGVSESGKEYRSLLIIKRKTK